MSITEQIDELLKLSDKATPGPWNVYKYGITHAGGTVVSWDHGTQDHDGVNEPADKPFIVATRNRIPALLRVLNALLEERTALVRDYHWHDAVEATDAAIREAEKEPAHAAE